MNQVNFYTFTIKNTATAWVHKVDALGTNKEDAYNNVLTMITQDEEVVDSENY